MPRRILLALAVAALTLPALPAQAQRHATDGFALQRVAQGRISLEQAIAKVQRATGGRVLDARATGDGYRIKVLTREGDVRVVYVDARTGEMR
jgi:uncharacterized membrane protein YkoI